MRKSITMLCVLISTFVMAQESLSEKSKVGIKGGYNLASAVIESDNEVGNRKGFHVGIYNELFLHSRLALQTELLYSQQGYKINSNVGTFTQKLDYLNLPVMLKGYLLNNFYIEAGPQFGVAINHSEQIDANFDLFDSETEFAPNDYDFGLNIGTGFRTNSGITLGVRYYFGNTKVYNQENQKNRVLQISAGFGF